GPSGCGGLPFYFRVAGSGCVVTSFSWGWRVGLKTKNPEPACRLGVRTSGCPLAGDPAGPGALYRLIRLGGSPGGGARNGAGGLVGCVSLGPSCRRSGS